MSRATELLDAAADELERGSDPFHHAWLAEHDVTLDECMDLAEGLATAARIYLRLMEDVAIGGVIGMAAGLHIAEGIMRG